MRNPFLIGEKVYLRALELADCPIFVQWLNDPAVQRTTLLARPVNLQDEQDYVERMRQSKSDIATLIVDRHTDQSVGVIALHDIDWRNRHGRFGLVIGEPGNWDKGYGTEAMRLMVSHAFASLNLNRLWLAVDEYNARGIRCYEKAGFQKEGLMRQEHFRDGRYWSTWLMSILSEEWAAKR
jgi:[ribosomal protein S5]-alanine N-acetyltransferase